ncbi:AAA family ATPase [bacterium]|nr:AAA family ATPase [bacterium]
MTDPLELPKSAAELRCRLSAADLQLDFPVEELGFVDTSELQPLDGLFAHPRALEALDLGAGIAHRNYHIYAAGLEGTGRLNLLREALQQRVDGKRVPSDWVYVNNFAEADRPLAIEFPAGHGVEFRDAIQELVHKLVEAIPRAFREEDFSREKERLRTEYRKRGEAIGKDLEAFARDHGMTSRQMPDGNIVYLPRRPDGEPMTPEEIDALPAERMEEIESHRDELMQKASETVEQQRQMMLDINSDIRSIAREFAERLVKPWIDELAERFPAEKVRNWLDGLRQHIISHLDRFRSELIAGESGIPLSPLDPELQERFLDYQVNVLVDNSECSHPPVVIENAPNYRNLFGTIERVVDKHGRVMTNFTRIKSGSLLKANGGFLVFDLLEALREPFVWKELKRTLKSGEIQIEVYDPFSMFSVTAMQPEPIPVEVRLVAAGPPLIYHLLCLYDEDFSRVFRVKADFDSETLGGKDACVLYGQFVRRLCEKENTLPFTSDAVVELVRSGARLAEHRGKVSTEFTWVADIIREADFHARRAGVDAVTAEHVRTAEERRVFRSNRVAEKIRELIVDGTLLFNLRDRSVGQINGLAVADLGDYAFGRPTRITASVGIGAAGIVNIERESHLSGQTFDKGVLILEGYLRNRYAQNHPLALSASLAMEQSYGGIDGDSASAAELLALLSALAEIPLRQDIAITGSIDQWGAIQAIGGVNEKVEGFFDACRETGLTGTQGVCLPKSNVRNLVLRPDVLQAIADEQFHLWAISDIDDAIELLTGVPAGDTETSDTFHYAVADRLAVMIDILKEQPLQTMPLIWTPDMPTLPEDPRPPMPGEFSEQ